MGRVGDVMIAHMPALVAAALLLLTPLLFAGFAPAQFLRLADRVRPVHLPLLSAVLSIPYLTVSISYRAFSLPWFLLYLLLPPSIVGLLLRAKRLDPGERGTAVDYVVLALLGLAVDLRWLEPAWPPHLAVFNKVLLLDVGIVGFLGARRLSGVGFDLRLRAHDALVGLREFALYAPAAIGLGLWLGFLHLHAGWPRPGQVTVAALFTFFFIAVQEELFFRGWMQNLLERRLGRWPALTITAILFGLSHFNKRAMHFNWRYVLLAALAGVFYGRAWRQDRRVAASALTHTFVDTIWSLTLR